MKLHQKYKLWVLVPLLSVGFLTVGNVLAQPTVKAATATQVCPDGTTVAATSTCPREVCPKPSFFGLVPWYQYLTLTRSKPDNNKPDSKNNTECLISTFQVLPNGSIKSDIPLVLLAIVDDLLRIAGLVAVGYVLYGGIMFITSQGSPDGTAKAQSTVTNALIGLAIALIAVAAVSFIGNKLG